MSANVWMSRCIDQLLPRRVREDGNKAFLRDVLPRAVGPGDLVYDLGGGSRPFVSSAEKRRLGLTVVGLDIDADELANAPPGVYDRTIATDLCKFVGPGDADVVICQATMEHLPDNKGAMRALASTVKPGGRIFIFAPSRNALFAHINKALPEALKRKMLFALFPEKAGGHDGFKAFYDRCTPQEMEDLARANGLVVEERRLFWISSYFTVFTPAFILWRMYQGINYLILNKNAAESFIYVFRKSELGGQAEREQRPRPEALERRRA